MAHRPDGRRRTHRGVNRLVVARAKAHVAVVVLGQVRCRIIRVLEQDHQLVQELGAAKVA